MVSYQSIIVIAVVALCAAWMVNGARAKKGGHGNGCGNGCGNCRGGVEPCPRGREQCPKDHSTK